MDSNVKSEWSFYYDIMGENESLPETVKDTFKRIKNLEADIDKALKSDKDGGYNERLQNAYKKFISKLNKIKYKNYLELQCAILSYIDKNEEYFGLNLYGFEREMKLSITTLEIDRLSKCQSDEERCDALGKFIILAGICFPKVYESFRQLSLNNIKMCASEFPTYLQTINISSCLILDELVENGIFGDDWENLFRESIDGLVDLIFYNQLELDVTLTPESQKYFMDLCAAPVAYRLSMETGVILPPMTPQLMISIKIP